MATMVTGQSGSVTLTGTDPQDAYVTRWEASIVRDIFDYTSFDTSSSWKEKIGGMVEMSGNLTAWCDATASPALGGLEGEASGTASAQLIITTNVGFSFTIIYSGLRVTDEALGQVQIAMDFVSAGDVAELTA